MSGRRTPSVWVIVHPSRHAQLEQWAAETLDAELGSLRLVTPSELLSGSQSLGTPVSVVIDGESLLHPRERRLVLRQLRARAEVQHVVFVGSRPARLEEQLDAQRWADTVLEAGWSDASGIRDALVGSARPSGPAAAAPVERLHGGLDRSQRGRAPPGAVTLRPGAGAAVDALFRQGERAGVLAISRAADVLCVELLEEFRSAEARIAASTAEELEESFLGCASPVTAARFSGARHALEMHRVRLARLCRQQLAALGEERAG